VKAIVSAAIVALIVLALPGRAAAQASETGANLCDRPELPRANAVRAALVNAVNLGAARNGGLGNNMWATVVDRFGTVCLIVNSTAGSPNAVWLGARVASAQKANTGNSFSVAAGGRGAALALSSANLYSATRPGGALVGLADGNPVNTAVAYAGDQGKFGAGAGDPMVGRKIGGVSVHGGGLALYNRSGLRVGGLGVSGDTPCADHFVAWRVRQALGLDYVPGGVSPRGDDNMVQPETDPDGFGHPRCLNNRDPETLPAARRPAGPS